MTITNEIAWHLRFDRQLALPTNREYESKRVAEIAKRQSELMAELNQLDVELDALTREQ